MNEKKKPTWLTIAGLIALIIVLCLCVELIFMFLGRAIPQQGQASQSGVSSSLEQVPEESQTAQGPGFCPFCGEGLTSSFQWGQYCPWCGELIEQ